MVLVAANAANLRKPKGVGLIPSLVPTVFTNLDSTEIGEISRGITIFHAMIVGKSITYYSPLTKGKQFKENKSQSMNCFLCKL